MTFPRTLIFKGDVIAFIIEEATGCITEEAIGAINKAAIGAIITPRNPPFCFYISCFTVSVTPSVNRLGFSSNFTILIISFITSFEMNKMNPFSVRKVSSLLIFF